MDSYFNGICNLQKSEEDDLLKTKNTGKLGEDYVSSILDNINVKYIKNIRIVVDNTYIVPDFYLPDFDIILEVKSRSYNCRGTASEKHDNIPRKYSKIYKNQKYLNTKIIVVFCAAELVTKSTLDLIYPESEYDIEFINLSKKFNIIAWSTCKEFVKYLKVSVKPVIKWAGGKTKLKSEIMSHFPETFNQYYEPFAGGFAIGFSLDYSIKKELSDTNARLINLYETIKSNPERLTSSLKNYKNELECFNISRKLMNTDPEDKVLASSLFLYINKCCYNGLYRENNLGKFNVPFGKMKDPVICDDILLKNTSVFLKNTNISVKNYNEIRPETGDLVYLDPPYHNTFSKYNKNDFTEKNQIELKEFVDKLTKDGVKVVLSNNNTQFIKDLYKDYTQILLNTSYSVGGNRGGKTEILIKNY